MDFTLKDAHVIEKMIRISKQKPLQPETYIPWEYEDIGDEQYMPDYLISLSGTKYFDALSRKEKTLLGKHELTQVMYAYGWSETMACAFFNNRLMKLSKHDVEYRFLTRELIEEYRHQNMFCDAIRRIDGQPIPISKLHRWIARMTIKFAPDSIVFFSVLAIELATDVYGDLLRKEPQIHPVIQRVSKLHHIEESRHIHYAQLWLKKATENAGIIKRSWFATVIILNLLFMRSMYTNIDIFQRMNFNHPKKVVKVAKSNLAKKFGKYCLKDTIEYIDSFKGWNMFSRFLARKILNAPV